MAAIGMLIGLVMIFVGGHAFRVDVQDEVGDWAEAIGSGLVIVGVVVLCISTIAAFL